MFLHYKNRKSLIKKEIKMKVNKWLMLSILLLPIVLYGWEYQYNGPASGPDSARALVYGADGNIYVAGTSSGSGTGYDFTVLSLTVNGDTNWTYRYNGTGNGDDLARAITYGTDGNIYVGGSCVQTGTGYDLLIISLNAETGDTNWTYKYAGTLMPAGYDISYSIVYGEDGNIYAAGMSESGPTNYKYDIFVVSVTNTGTERWTYQYNRSGESYLNDYAYSIDYGDGNVYVAGYAEAVGVSRDFTVISLVAETGDTNWIRCYNGTNNSVDQASSIVYGEDGNIYAAGQISNTGTFQDFAVVSCDTNGNTNWIYQYSGSANSSDDAFSIDYGTDGNIYAAGYIRGSNQSDFAVISLTSAGDTNWTYTYDGTANNNDQAHSVVYGADGNIYAAGVSYNTGAHYDFTVISLTEEGDTNWTYLYNGSSNTSDGARSIVYGANGGIYAAGYCNGTSMDIFVMGMKPGMHDVGPFSIDMPQFVYVDTVISPQATIRNYGTSTEPFLNVICQISPGGYIDTCGVYNLPLGDSWVIFEEFQFGEIGDYTVTVYSLLDDDENPVNDTLEMIIEVGTIDVAPISIDMPDTILQDTTFNPQATVKNLGTDTETFPVRCMIEPGGYIKTQTVNNLEPGDSIQVTFTTPFTFESDVYTVKVFTMHGDDRNPSNDTLVKVIESHPGVAEDGSKVPILFSFGLQNNPAKGRALFNLALPHDGLVTLKIYDVTGRLVSNLSDRKSAGYYQIPWISKANGVYFYTFESKEYKENGKLVVIR
jgi:uncharacterized delta-60 repeat protein